MIKINLIAEAPTTAAKKQKRPEISLGARQGDTILLITLVLFLSVTGGIWYKMKSETERLTRERNDKRVERDSLQKFIDRAEELETQREKLRRKIEVIKQLKDSQRGPVRIMDEASRALPDLVWLDRLKLSGSTLTISGKAMDSNAVANYISNLDASPFFLEPNLTNLASRGEEVFVFQLDCTFTHSPAQIEGGGGDDGG